MTDTITKAMNLARSFNQPPPSAASGHVQPERICPTARAVQLSRQLMEQNRLIGGIADQRVIDSYLLLRTRVLNRVHQSHIRTLGITSPSTRDGKSLTAANLAISIALGESHPILLVDADVRRPSLGSQFGIKVDAGLGDYLAGDAGLEELLLRTPIHGLYLLPGRTESTLRPEALSADKVRQLAARLKQQVPGGIVVFDLPPALIGGDVAAFAPNVDAMLLVVANRRTSEDAMARTVPLLEGANIIGTVLNYADEAGHTDDYYLPG
ncbi:MAG: CpsD/CapB family tyrosine-protein kinase [Aquisalimonadaceae bacterium]